MLAAVLIAGFCAAQPAAGTNIVAGEDLWTTPCGATYDYVPIPADFFDPGSDPFDGISLMGSQLLNNQVPFLAPVDTIVRRLADANPPCLGEIDIPIEIVALSLVSCSPITVTYVASPAEAWNVDVCLDVANGAQPIGSMTIRHECFNGGTYSATLPVRALLTFTRPSDGATRTIVHQVSLASSGWWSHADPGFGLLTINLGTQVDSDCDGVIEPTDMTSIGSSNFFPGLYSLDCTSCTAPGTFKKPMTDEQERWAAHGVYVANPDKPRPDPNQQVGACCAGFPNPPNTCVVVDCTSCQFTWNGSCKPPGTTCSPNPCIPGNPLCGNGTCEGPVENKCTCPLDCGASPANEVGLCTGGIDDDCDGAIDCADTADCATDPACAPPELCSLPAVNPWCTSRQATDCVVDNVSDFICLVRQARFTGTGWVIEKCDCFTSDPGCGPVDIAPKTPSGFTVSCPGPCAANENCYLHFDDGTGPVAQSTNSMNSSAIPAGVLVTCACVGKPCGDGVCDPSIGENQCTCPADCGTHPASETGLCTDGIDNDCDKGLANGGTDCTDPDCASDPACGCKVNAAQDGCTGTCTIAGTECLPTVWGICGPTCIFVKQCDCDVPGGCTVDMLFPGGPACNPTTCPANENCTEFFDTVNNSYSCDCVAKVGKCVGPGQDCFTTACDGKTKYDFGPNPVPAGHFCGTDTGFAGVVTLGGAGGFPGDTVVLRKGQLCFGSVLPDTATVPIELVQLSLVSCSPITVVGCTQALWDVYVGIPVSPPQTQGALSATKTDASGGTFTASLPVNAVVSFGPAGSGAATTAPIPAAKVVLNTVCASTWLQNCPTGVCDFGCGHGGFSAGWDIDQQGRKCCRETCHANPAGGHEHCTIPPDCQPCPTAGKTENCNDEIDNDGDGLCDCADPDCATVPKCKPPFKNWVIADDFMVGCAQCTCDLNRDGIGCVPGVVGCDQADIDFMNQCIAAPEPKPPQCRNADLECDGDVDGFDGGAFSCLCQGYGADVCCPNPRPRPEINKLRWYGSYLDPAFEHPDKGGTRDPDGWYIALHSDLPPMACPAKPGVKTIDLCGTLVQGVECIMFQPNGSTNLYSIQDATLLTQGGYGVGDTVRICGHIATGPSFCMQGIAGIVVNAAMDCDTGVSRPDRLIAQWVFNNVDVDRQSAFKYGCDSHQIYSYAVDLTKGCLVHNNAGLDEIPNPNGAFYPRNGRTYWLSIQAEVGAAWVKTPTHQCTESKTGQTITQPFWGWHTTPPGYQQKDDAYMGQLAMGCPDEWLYEWTMGPLHCSDPRFRDCCDDPTKSIDMAFCLLQETVGMCTTGAPISCTTDADCPTGSTCLGGVNVTWWCQPVNGGGGGGGDPPSIPRPFPLANVDELTNTNALVVVNLVGETQPRDLQLNGPVVVARTGGPDQVQPQPEPPLPLPSTIETEMLMLELRGGGGEVLRLNPDPPYGGRSAGPTNSGNPLGGVHPWPADSFFDVFIEVEIPGRPPVVSEGAVRIEAQIHEAPPGPVSYQGTGGPTGQSVQLRDKRTGDVVGRLIFVSHQIIPRGGFDIHSDTDWVGIPQDPCCQPDRTTPTLCSMTTCPNADEKCYPTAIAYDALGRYALDCACQKADKCRLAVPEDLILPICMNSCPDSTQQCLTMGDGTATNPYKCVCDQAPVCEPNAAGTACVQACTTGQECIPKKVKCTPGSTSCSIVECQCKDQNCHVDLNAAGLPYCVNPCPNAAYTCRLNGVDTDADGVLDLFDCFCQPPPECAPNSLGTGCNPVVCPGADEKCKPKCVVFNPLTGQTTLDTCDCLGPTECHMELATPPPGGGAASVAGAGATGDPCVVVDDGSGTVTLPPVGCEYLSPDEFHKIVDGLPAGVTIEIAAIHKKFICNRQPADPTFCSFPIPPGLDCDDEEPNDPTDGAKECHDSTLELHMRGNMAATTAGPSTYMATKMIPVMMETHTGPRMPGDPVQSFDTDMFRLQGALPPGDPDFDLLRITGGTDFGMPSPGHTTLTKMGGTWAVDSFFDIEYEIDYIGAPAPSPFAGMSGSTTATIRMATKPFKCVGDCPAGNTCVEKREVQADGTIKVCCECPPGVIVWDSNDRASRSLRFDVNPPATATGSGAAIKVTMVDLQTPNPENQDCCPAPNFHAFDMGSPPSCLSCTGEACPADASGQGGCARWVGEWGEFRESQDVPSAGAFIGARLQCTPYYGDWKSKGLITVLGAEILPSSTYSVQAYGASCKGSEAECTNVSAAVEMKTHRSGDVVTPFNLVEPNGLDINEVINKFKGLTSTPKALAQLTQNVVDPYIDVGGLDISAVIDAFKSFAYSHSGPCPCPSTVTCGSVACPSLQCKTCVGGANAGKPCSVPADCPSPGTCTGTVLTCVKTCLGGDNIGDPCIKDIHCPPVGNTCGNPFCRDRCGRCN